MTDQHLTLKEAQEFTGKSRSTLRRFVESIVKADDSPDRHFLRPSIEEVAELKRNNQPFSWRVATELLAREYPKESAAGDAVNGSVSSDGDRIITVLEKTVTVLQEELTEKNKQIAAFQDRQAEHNVLLKQLQQQLSLTAAAGESASSSETNSAVVNVEQTPVETDSMQAPATNQEQKPESKIPFHWLFQKR